MSSAVEQYDRWYDVIYQALSQKRVSKQTFETFKEALVNISRLLSEDITTDSLGNVTNTLTEYFQKDSSGIYTANIEREESCRKALTILENTYKLKLQSANTGKDAYSEGLDNIATSFDHSTSLDQSSGFMSNAKERSTSIISLNEDKNGKTEYVKGLDENDMNEFKKKNGHKMDNDVSEIAGCPREKEDSGDIQTPHPQPNIRKEEMYINKIEKELDDSKQDIKSKNQIILDLNIQLAKQTTQYEGDKEYFKTRISQLESERATENNKKSLEIARLNKEISDLRKQSMAELSSKNVLQYKISVVEGELQKVKDVNDNLQSKLELKNEQLKKTELEIETQKSVAVTESKRHQEKSKELQEFKTKSTELQNNLRIRNDELVSNLRELSECKNELIRYSNINGDLSSKLVVLQKDHDDLQSKFKIDSTDYRNKINSLKEQLSREREAKEKVNAAYILNQQELSRQSDAYSTLTSNHKNLKDAFDKKVAVLNDKIATNQELQNKVKDMEDENSELNKILAGAHLKLAEINDELLDARKHHGIYQTEIAGLQNNLEKTKFSLTDQQNQLCIAKQENIDLQNKLMCYINEQNKNRCELEALIEKSFKVKTIEDFFSKEKNNAKEKALSQLAAIKSEVDGYREEVCKFNGSTKSKTYLNLAEMIQKCVEKVDQIQSQNITEVQEEKRQIIKYCAAVDKELQSRARAA